MATAAKKAKGAVQKSRGGVVRRERRRLVSKLGKRLISSRLPSAPDVLREITERAREQSLTTLAERVRGLPIQRSVDVAVPLEVAYEEWMKLDFLPEGSHRIEEIERDGDGVLTGRLSGPGHNGEWEAEVREERPGESFAWRSVAGSDCAGLVTFHRLGDRLTRIELELDLLPIRAEEAFELMLHLADRRAEADLRRFKARVEMISPEEYPPLDEEADNEDVEADNE